MKVLGPVSKIVDIFRSMPNIGPRMAERLAYFLIKNPVEYSKKLAECIMELKESIKYCDECCNFTDKALCDICEDNSRGKNMICVVEDVHDLVAVEKTRCYNGLYHVLHGRLSPLDGIGPDDLTISGLLRRLEAAGVEEIILATNPNVEGEATAAYISQLVKPLGIKATRLAQGVPRGGDIEYVDGITLKRAFQERKEI